MGLGPASVSKVVGVCDGLSQADLAAISEYSHEFLEAARYGEREDLELIFSHPRLKELIDFPRLVDNETGTSPLMYASANGFSDCVEYLIDHVEVDINWANKSGNTALHWSSLNGHSVVVEYLIKKGGNVMAKNLYGKTPFDEAFVRDRKECCELIAKEECRLIREQNPEDDYMMVTGTANLDSIQE